jgi:hypothetical protein
MVIRVIDRATKYISECLRSDAFLENLEPKFFDKINWTQEILLELIYRLKKLDYELLIRNPDIAIEKEVYDAHQKA